MAEITSTDRLARAGYFARAAVYGLLGYLAFASSGKAADGAKGVFDFVREIPAGKIVLVALALGLVAYALYKLAVAAFDLDGVGTDAKGVFKRIGSVAGGIAYLALAYAAVRISAGEGSNSGGAGPAGDVLRLPGGGVLLAAGGLGFLIAAAFQLRSAWTQSFLRRIEPGAPPATAVVGRIGLAARSVVFAIIGWSLMKAAWSKNESEVRDLGGVLRDLHGSDVLYPLVAGGLVLFALYSAIEARYRIVPRVDIADEAARRGGTALR
ncbi:MAG: DUF1206 domain-containing protein [Pseudomonadota bacterium]